MQDEVSCHRSKIVTNCFRVYKFTLLKWPENSLDLNPIKNFWTVLKDKVTEKHSSNIPAFIEAIKLVWISETPKKFFKILIESMPRQIKKVIKKKRTTHQT